MSQAHTRTQHEGLLALLTEQRDLYARLRELSHRQRALISGDRPELLLNILRDRQTLVSGLIALNERLGPYRRNWDEMYAALPTSVRSEASALLSEINGTLRTILQTDQEDSAILSVRKQAVGRDLGELTGGHSANRAYAPAGPAHGGGAADLKG